MMFQVLYALIPGALAAMYFFGWGVLFNLGIAISICLASEALMLKLRKRNITTHLTDGSALVTACLLALALPPLAPWWLTTIACLFAIVVAKHLYGGLGFNPFNPAMVGYIVVMISFPLQMTLWTTPISIGHGWPDFLTTFHWVFGGHLPTNANLDSISMATPMDIIKTQLHQSHFINETRASDTYKMFFGTLSGVGWQWINSLYLIGGIWLIKKGVIDWRIPVALLIGLAFFANLFQAIDFSTHTSAIFQLFSGGIMLGAFFIATDPITASTTPKGRWLYGFGIGTLIFIIRTWGGYPDGIAFAVVIMNMVVPIIDYYTLPKIYGHSNN